MTNYYYCGLFVDHLQRVSFISMTQLCFELELHVRWRFLNGGGWRLAG